MLIEYEIKTRKLLSATIGGIEFSELPETSASCIVEDAETAEAIWFSHVNGGEVIISVDEFGEFLFADIEEVEPVVPEEPKTPDQLRIEQLESDLATAHTRFEDIELMLVDMLMGGV